MSIIQMHRPTGTDRQAYMRERAAIAALLLAQGLSINDVARRLQSSRPFVQRVVEAQAALDSCKIA
jgi:transposase